MAEYIDRSAGVSILRAKANMAVLMDAAPYFEKAAQMLEKLPAADVAPVRYVRWIKHDDGVFTCSECGNAESNESHFCRYCGAKMMEG